jgi:hypothetical protein
VKSRLKRAPYASQICDRFILVPRLLPGNAYREAPPLTPGCTVKPRAAQLGRLHSVACGAGMKLLGRIEVLREGARGTGVPRQEPGNEDKGNSFGRPSQLPHSEIHQRIARAPSSSGILLQNARLKKLFDVTQSRILRTFPDLGVFRSGQLAFKAVK